MKSEAFAIALCLACGLAPAGPVVSIALRPRVEVSGPVVTLGDVAVLTASELEPLRTLVNLPLGRVPAAGEAVTVQREALAGWVRAKAGPTGDSLRWSGPATMQLVSSTRRVTGEEIAAAAAASLRGWLATRGASGDPELLTLPRDLDVPDGELRLRPRALDAASLRTRALVWVEVWVAERFVRAVAVPFHIMAGDFASPLREQTLSPLVVHRGQWASLRSGTGAVALEARVEVLQDGRLGDSVRVRQPGAAAGVIARVTGPAQLELAR